MGEGVGFQRLLVVLMNFEGVFSSVKIVVKVKWKFWLHPAARLQQPLAG